MIVLGIETSCDETAAAVVNCSTRQILSNVILTQAEHIDYGGVVPEIASRAHYEALAPIAQQALSESGKSLQEIDLIAATTGPGLVGALLVGSSYGKSLALGAHKPFAAVHHLEGHALSPHLTEGIDLPYLLLLVSGGHCQFVMVHGIGHYEELGATRDDAIGECFDKVAKLLDLPYPGGPHVEKTAQTGDPNAIAFPRPLDDKSLDFSFAGLKTAVRNHVVKNPPQNEQDIANVCASFQHTVATLLSRKVANALAQTGVKNFVIAGGVAANQAIRHALQQTCNQHGVTFAAPALKLCTDNAAMIAYAAGMRALNDQPNGDITTAIRPRWPLQEQR